jgi:hypothetical protein
VYLRLVTVTGIVPPFFLLVLTLVNGTPFVESVLLMMIAFLGQERCVLLLVLLSAAVSLLLVISMDLVLATPRSVPSLDSTMQDVILALVMRIVLFTRPDNIV